jgi:hypothetical protein
MASPRYSAIPEKCAGCLFAAGRAWVAAERGMGWREPGRRWLGRTTARVGRTTGYAWPAWVPRTADGVPSGVRRHATRYDEAPVGARLPSAPIELVFLNVTFFHVYALSRAVCIGALRLCFVSRGAVVARGGVT